MKNWIPSLSIVTLFLFCLVISSGHTGYCTTLRAMSLERLTSTSDAVVLGRAIEAQSVRWHDGRIVTYVTYQVDQYVTGNGPPRLTVRLLGGTMDGITQYVHGEASLPMGEATLLFLEQTTATENSTFVVTGLSQGVFRIVAPKDAPGLFAVRDLGTLELIDLPLEDKLDLARDRTSTFIPLSTLTTLIREMAEQVQ